MTGSGERVDPPASPGPGARKAFLIGPLPPPLSGQTVAFRMLCEGFRRRGLDHRTIDFSAGRRRGDGEISWQRLTSLIGPLAGALTLIGRRPATVYLTNAQSFAGFVKDAVFIAAARLGGHRIVLHLHGGNYGELYRAQSPLRRLAIRRTLALAERLVVLGEALRDMYDFVPGHRDKVVVVPNGLPEDLPGWDGIRASKASGGGPIRILYLSNLIESKGYLDMLEAVRRLVHDEGRDVQADFGGDFRFITDARLYRTVDEARADFLRRIEAHGLGDRVTWHGTVSGDHKRRLLARAHYFVLPTTYKYEGQPISIIEAMAHGALVISTRHRTIPEMLDDGRAGVLVEPGRPDRIVEAILDHPVGSRAYRERVEAARRRCVERYGRERHLDDLIAVILGATDALPAGRGAAGGAPDAHQSIVLS